MKTKTLIRLAAESVLEKGVEGLEIIEQMKRVCAEKPFGSLAYHHECDCSTLILEHPYSFFTEDYEARKQEHLKSIEDAKKDEELTIVQADETTLQYSYERFVEGYGKEERIDRCWLHEVSKAHPFSTDDIQDVEYEKTYLMTYASYKGDKSYLGAYGDLECGVADLKTLIPFFKKIYPLAKIEVSENISYIVERITVKFPDESENFIISLESMPFHP